MTFDLRIEVHYLHGDRSFVRVEIVPMNDEYEVWGFEGVGHFAIALRRAGEWLRDSIGELGSDALDTAADLRMASAVLDAAAIGQGGLHE